jgi:ubiquitin carboxyl-terminal hydrolase 5/13
LYIPSIINPLGKSVQVNENDLQSLMQMGFPRVRCEKALIKTNNNGPEAAMEWLFQHMEDPGWLSYFFSE